MKVSAGSVSLNVVATGAGNPTLLFLHYWGGSARTWEKVIDVLQREYRCVAYDQRGWGSSDAPVTGYELKDLAEDASALIAAMGLQRYALVGHSMGGKVAQLLASYRPTGLEALILVAPASPLPQHIPDDAREAQIHAYDSRETALGAADFLTIRKPDDETLERLVQDSLSGSPGAKHAWPASVA